MADDTVVRFGGEASGLIDAISQVRSALQSLSKPILDVEKNLGEMKEAFIAVFAVREIDHFVESMTEMAVQTERTSALLGISTSEVAGMSVAADLSGGSLENLTTSMERLGLSLVRADAGSRQAQAALAALGITTAQFRALKPEEQIELLTSRLAVLKDGLDKDAIEMALFSRGGAAVALALQRVAEGKEIAKRAGTVMPPEEVASFEKTSSLLVELGASFTGVGITIMTYFKPALDGIVKVLIDVVERFNNAATAGGPVAKVLALLATDARVFATALSVAVGAVETLFTTGKTAFTALAVNAKGLGTIIYDAFTFNLSGAKEAFSALMTANKGVVINAAGDMKTIIGNMMSELKLIWGRGADDQVKIAQTKDARMRQVNTEELSARLSVIDAEVEAEQQKLKRIVDVLDNEAKRGEITQQQKFAAEEEYTQKAYEAELALLQKKAIIAQDDVKQHKTVLNEISKLQQDHGTEMVQIDEKALDASEKQWQGYFNTLTSAFNGNIRGLLEGTESWHKAMMKTLESLVINFIEAAEKMLVIWISKEIAKTTASVSGAAEREAAETGASAGGIASTIANALKAIFAGGGQTAAGVSAAVAPESGPAAPAIGAAAGTSIVGLAVGIGQFEVGGYVNKPGLAFVHSGEIVPAAQVDSPYRGAGAGGGEINVHAPLTVQAIDSQSIARFFGDNSHHMVDAMVEAIKHGARHKMAAALRS